MIPPDIQLIGLVIVLRPAPGFRFEIIENELGGTLLHILQDNVQLNGECEYCDCSRVYFGKDRASRDWDGELRARRLYRASDTVSIHVHQAGGELQAPILYFHEFEMDGEICMKIAFGPASFTGSLRQFLTRFPREATGRHMEIRANVFQINGGPVIPLEVGRWVAETVSGNSRDNDSAERNIVDALVRVSDDVNTWRG